MTSQKPAKKQKPRQKSTQRALASMLFAFEAFVVFFGVLGTFMLKGFDGPTVWSIGLTLSVLMILTPAILGKPGSYIWGWALQVSALVLSIAVSVINPTVGAVYIIVSVIFIGLWIWAMVAGAGIDAARKVYLETQALLNEEN
jgi:hypothetical protein